MATEIRRYVGQMVSDLGQYLGLVHVQEQPAPAPVDPPQPAPVVEVQAAPARQVAQKVFLGSKWLLDDTTILLFRIGTRLGIDIIDAATNKRRETKYFTGVALATLKDTVPVHNKDGSYSFVKPKRTVHCWDTWAGGERVRLELLKMEASGSTMWRWCEKGTPARVKYVSSAEYAWLTMQDYEPSLKFNYKMRRITEISLRAIRRQSELDPETTITVELSAVTIVANTKSKNVCVSEGANYHAELIVEHLHGKFFLDFSDQGARCKQIIFESIRADRQSQTWLVEKEKVDKLMDSVREEAKKDAEKMKSGKGVYLDPLGLVGRGNCAAWVLSKVSCLGIKPERRFLLVPTPLDITSPSKTKGTGTRAE